MNDSEAIEVPSPCVQVCCLDEALGFCVGCGRTRFEIAYWTQVDADTKREIVASAARRLQAS